MDIGMAFFAFMLYHIGMGGGDVVRCEINTFKRCIHHVSLLPSKYQE